MNTSDSQYTTQQIENTMKPQNQNQDSASVTRARFDSLASSLKYAGALDNTPTHRRELRCINCCLEGVPGGAHVLDLPCGAGRLLPSLVAAGYQVFAADSSAHMLERAKELVGKNGLKNAVEFGVENVLDTSFADNTFDAVLCNRLFHHFFESEVRVTALRELRRICRGPIVISFFCSQSISSASFLIKNRFRRIPATDRVPVSFKKISADIAAAGLAVELRTATKPLLGKQWYLRLVDAEER
jgi:ubiquinone/menaquinone biosynthesis C-methylase UbiE